MGVALRLFCCYALYLPFYGVFLFGCIVVRLFAYGGF